MGMGFMRAPSHAAVEEISWVHFDSQSFIAVIHVKSTGLLNVSLNVLALRGP